MPLDRYRAVPELVLVARVRSGDTTVGDICTHDLVTVSPADDLARATQMMRQAAVRRLPVVEGERLIGVISLGDLAIERDEGSVLADISAADPNS